MTGKQGMAVIVGISVLVGCWLGYGFANRIMQSNAIKEDCAHYDPKTSEFKWGPLQ